MKQLIAWSDLWIHYRKLYLNIFLFFTNKNLEVVFEKHFINDLKNIFLLKTLKKKKNIVITLNDIRSNIRIIREKTN